MCHLRGSPVSEGLILILGSGRRYDRPRYKAKSTFLNSQTNFISLIIKRYSLYEVHPSFYSKIILIFPFSYSMEYLGLFRRQSGVVQGKVEYAMLRNGF